MEKKQEHDADVQVEFAGDKECANAGDATLQKPAIYDANKVPP